MFGFHQIFVVLCFLALYWRRACKKTLIQGTNPQPRCEVSLHNVLQNRLQPSTVLWELRSCAAAQLFELQWAVQTSMKFWTVKCISATLPTARERNGPGGTEHITEGFRSSQPASSHRAAVGKARSVTRPVFKSPSARCCV